MWRPNKFVVTVLAATSQMIHCAVIHVDTQKHFYLTFVYGYNKHELRRPLWHNLQTLSHQTPGAWCVLGDFNAVLHIQDRIGGDDIQDADIKDFADCLTDCELMEIRSSGAYYSWSSRGCNGQRI